MHFLCCYLVRFDRKDVDAEMGKQEAVVSLYVGEKEDLEEEAVDDD